MQGYDPMTSARRLHPKKFPDDYFIHIILYGDSKITSAITLALCNLHNLCEN